MTLPGDLPRRPAAEAARFLALEQLGEAERASKRLGDASDGDSLHDFRVSVRRLRSLLRSWRPELEESVRKQDRKDLRWLQDATGEARDAEVAGKWVEARVQALGERERAGAERIAAGLRKRAFGLDARLARKIQARIAQVAERLHGRLERRVVVLHLGQTFREPSWARAEAAAVARAAHELDVALERAGASGERGELHAARIRGKRLRYLLEPARAWSPAAVELVDRLRGLQDILGEIQDANVLSDELEREDSAQADGELDSGLAVLARLNQERLHALLQRVRGEWLAGGLSKLLEDLDAFGRAFAALGGGIERERKYLLDRMPDLPAGAEVLEVEQGWLPGDRLRERLRRVRGPQGERFERALKLGAGLERTEIEEPIARELFEALWPLTASCCVRKRRHRVRAGGVVWEIDEFLDRPLALAEVELELGDDRPELPAWLAPRVVREVTDEGAFTNLGLAEAGVGSVPG
jgi:CHAD domain-containing protein/CYTH domain-containing protein